MDRTNLEGNNSDWQHRWPNHGQCIFAPQETGVEETDSWNHDKHERHGTDDEGEVADVVYGGRAIDGDNHVQG